LVGKPARFLEITEASVGRELHVELKDGIAEVRNIGGGPKSERFVVENFRINDIRPSAMMNYRHGRRKKEDRNQSMTQSRLARNTAVLDEILLTNAALLINISSQRMRGLA
jgi:hypothetical protein